MKVTFVNLVMEDHPMSDTQNTTTVIKDLGRIKVHTFVSPYALAANATHIIESENTLVLIDTQFVRPMAQAFRAYADSLRKPIDRVFISHGHPDHYFGLPMAFADQRACSVAEVAKIIGEWGPQMVKNQKPTFGPLIPDAVMVPTMLVKDRDVEIIDGVRYECDVVFEAESEVQLNLRLPEFGVHCVQDSVYSGVHLWHGMGWFDGWRRELQRILDLGGYDYILPGHGLPCGLEEVAQNLAYVETAERLHREGLPKDVFRARLIDAFPHRESRMMFDLYLAFLFGGMSSH